MESETPSRCGQYCPFGRSIVASFRFYTSTPPPEPDTIATGEHMNNNGPQNLHTGVPVIGYPPYAQHFQAQASTAGSMSFSTGYVHSGYHAAIGGTQHSSTRQMGTPPVFTQSQSRPPMRPPKLGPGGPIQCGHPGCPYSGYAKDVEVHRMDRHLIFPPGYKPPKGPPDADVG